MASKKRTTNKRPTVKALSDDLASLKESMDGWVKGFSSELSSINEVAGLVEENVGNTQHNYELIYELKSQIEELKQEIGALKLLQIIALKQKAAH